MNIGFPIDWAATGQMLIGFATLAGAAAVAYAAYKGADTFKQWKQQQVTARKMLFAEELLTTFYKFERSVGFVRYYYHNNTEIFEANEKLKIDVTNYSHITDERKNRLQTSQVVMLRVNKEREAIDNLIKLLPTTRALFGDIGDKVNEAWRLINRVGVAANSYADPATLLDENRQKLEAILFSYQDENDQIYTKMETIKNELEGKLLPIINDSYNEQH